MSLQNSKKTMYLLIALGAVFTLFSVAVLGALGMSVMAMNKGASRVQPRVQMGGMVVTDLVGASYLGTQYKPQSMYVEKGADSNVTAFGFSDGDVSDTQGRPLSEHDIQKVMYAHQKGLLECYSEGLEENEELAGRVDFHFRVAKDGHVGMIKITHSALRDKPTEDCMVDEARRWKFPSTNRTGYLKFDTHFDFMAN